MAFQLKIQDVLISDNLDNCCQEILSENGINVRVDTKLTKEDLLKEISNYDALIVRSATKVTSEVLQAGKRLKLVGRAGTGVDNIDIASATRNGVIVMNTPGGNTLSAAEHTCAMIAAMARNIPQAAASMKEGKWDRKKFMGNELFGKTLGIVGLGRIGLEVASRMQSFGMKTVGYDPLVSPERAAEFSIEWLELDKLWPLVDYITVHTPLIPQTKGLLNDKSFQMCKKGVRVVNCARGGIIDEDALLRALESGQCGGAALDVYVTEPPKDTSSQVVQHPKVISCPHLGASTNEAQKRVAKEIAEQILSATKGESLFGAINASSLGDALKPETGPWLDLSEKLAKVGTSFCHNKKILKTIITTSGASLERASSYVTPSVLMGLISSVGKTGNEVNLINAKLFANEMGLKVENRHVDKTPGCHCNSAVSLKLECSDESSITVTGAVLGSSLPTLLEVDQSLFSSPIVLTDKIYFFKVTTTPSKVVGQIIEHLAEENINVISLHSVWDGSHGMAVVKLNRDINEGSKAFGENGMFYIWWDSKEAIQAAFSDGLESTGQGSSKEIPIATTQVGCFQVDSVKVADRDVNPNRHEKLVQDGIKVFAMFTQPLSREVVISKGENLRLIKGFQSYCIYELHKEFSENACELYSWIIEAFFQDFFKDVLLQDILCTDQFRDCQLAVHKDVVQFAL